VTTERLSDGAEVTSGSVEDEQDEQDERAGGEAMREASLGRPEPEQPLRALPAQLIETDQGVILKRGVTTVSVTGDGAYGVVQRVLAATEHGATREEIRQFFALPDHQAVDALVEQLVARRILVPDGEQWAPGGQSESSLELFWWNFGRRPEPMAGQLDQRQLAVIGVNRISRQLVAALAATGVSNLAVVDYHLLRNIDLFDDLFDEAALRLTEPWPTPEHAPLPYREWATTLERNPPGCIVATSDFGGTQIMREWNRFCVERECHFLPVVLQDLIGYVGPLVVPGETACYECLRARENSHMENPVMRRTAERKAFEGQRVNGFHPSMASVLGDLAAMELTKLYSDLPQWRVGALIEVNLLVPSLVTRRVLKLPRCTVCGAMGRRVSPSLETSPYLQQGFRG